MVIIDTIDEVLKKEQINPKQKEKINDCLNLSKYSRLSYSKSINKTLEVKKNNFFT
jgi:hypothetical protein